MADKIIGHNQGENLGEPGDHITTKFHKESQSRPGDRQLQAKAEPQHHEFGEKTIFGVAKRLAGGNNECCKMLEASVGGGMGYKLPPHMEAIVTQLESATLAALEQAKKEKV